MLTPRDERVLVALSLASNRPRLERIARAVLDRDDAVTELLRSAATFADGGASWREAVAVLDRHGGNPFNLLDLVVEVGQQVRVRRGERRTWTWPGSWQQTHA